MARLSMVVRQLEQLVPLLGVGTEPGRDVVKALNSLAKHVPPGAVSPGVEQSAMQKMLLQQRQNGPQIAALRAAMGSQGKPPAAGATPPNPQAAPPAAA